MTTLMDLSTVVLDVASSAAAGLVLVAGLAALWGIKRVLELFGHQVLVKHRLNNLSMDSGYDTRLSNETYPIYGSSSDYTGGYMASLDDDNFDDEW